MAAFVEAFGFFTRWLTILAVGAPLAAVLSCIAGHRIARRHGARFEFTDALLFSAVGGFLGPTLGSAVALVIGALGSDVATFPRAANFLVNTALLGVLLGIAVGVPLGFVAAWAALRDGRDRPRSSRRRVSRGGLRIPSGHR